MKDINCHGELVLGFMFPSQEDKNLAPWKSGAKDKSCFFKESEFRGDTSRCYKFYIINIFINVLKDIFT